MERHAPTKGLTGPKHPSSVGPSRPDPFIVYPKAKHTHTAIFLHGLGSNGKKFGSELLETGISSSGLSLAESLPGTKFIFPTAFRSRCTMFKRSRINQWFNRASLEDPMSRTDLQVDGLEESARYIRSIFTQEMESVPPQNIILGGLSQGCAISLFFLLGLEFPIGGFVGMSGWLPFENDLAEIVHLGSSEDDQTRTSLVTFDDEESKGDNDAFLQAIGFVRDVLSIEEADVSGLTRERTCLGTPIFLGHGAKDERMKSKFGEAAANTLADLGFDVTWRCYPDLGHWYAIPDEIDDVLGFLQRALPVSEVCESVPLERGG